MAQEAMERYLLLRQTIALAFNNLDHQLPRMEYLINNGLVFYFIKLQINIILI